MSLGWKPADDDDAEDADAGDDADVRPRKANNLSGLSGISSPAACPAAQLDVAATTDCFEAYVIQHAIRDGWQPGGCASWSLFGGDSSTFQKIEWASNARLGCGQRARLSPCSV